MHFRICLNTVLLINSIFEMERCFLGLAVIFWDTTNLKPYSMCISDTTDTFFTMHQWGKSTYNWLHGPKCLFITILNRHQVIQNKSSRSSVYRSISRCNPHSDASRLCLSPRIGFRSVWVWPRLPPEWLTCTVRHCWEPVVTSHPVHIFGHWKSPAIPSDPTEHLEQGGNWVHAVEKV